MAPPLSHDEGDEVAVSAPQYLEWHKRNHVFDHFAAYPILPSSMNLFGAGEPQNVQEYHTELFQAEANTGRVTNPLRTLPTNLAAQPCTG